MSTNMENIVKRNKASKNKLAIAYLRMYKKLEIIFEIMALLRIFR